MTKESIFCGHGNRARTCPLCLGAVASAWEDTVEIGVGDDGTAIWPRSWIEDAASSAGEQTGEHD